MVMRLETKTDCADEGQQLFTRPTNCQVSQSTVKIRDMGLMEPENKNDYAGEGQQQFNGLTN
jgi:hypothetical protein